MTRSPIRASFSDTPVPTAATTPQGSWPAITGFGLAGNPVALAPPLVFGRRYWCRSLPHMPEAFISTTTSSGPGVGSGNSIISSSRAPVNTTPRMVPSCRWPGPRLERDRHGDESVMARGVGTGSTKSLLGRRTYEGGVLADSDASALNVSLLIWQISYQARPADEVVLMKKIR